jgi:release factor glutamine methyltransferase
MTLTSTTPNAVLRAETAAAAVREIAAGLASRGFDTPSLDARLLVEAATGESREALAMCPERALTPDERQRLDDYVTRRLADEPVSRILGRRSFYGREFVITRATLDPRPESETLIESALEIVAARGMTHQPVRLLDIGTGSGCLLLTLLAELPMATGVGTDPSAAALAVAAGNAQRIGVEERVLWAQADGLAGIAGPFDLAVANPPYIPSGEIAALPAAVRDYDPRLALDGGADGMAIYRRIIAAARRVVPAGALILEVGAGQADAVIELIRTLPGASSAGNIDTRMDLSGHTRCVLWRTH